MTIYISKDGGETVKIAVFTDVHGNLKALKTIARS